MSPRLSPERLNQLCMEGSAFPWRWSAVRTRDDGHRVLDVLAADDRGVAYVFYDDKRSEMDQACRRNQQLIAEAPNLALDLRDARRDIAGLTTQLAAKDAEIKRKDALLAAPERELINWHKAGCDNAIEAQSQLQERLDAAEVELAALKAVTGTVIEAMVEDALTGYFSDDEGNTWPELKDLPCAEPLRNSMRAALTAASLAPGTRADGLRQAAEIVENGGYDREMRSYAAYFAEQIRAELPDRPSPCDSGRTE